MEQVYVYKHIGYEVEQIKRSILDCDILSHIRNSDTVLLKPNFVQESRQQDDDWEYVITHPAVISAVIELLCPILSGKGRIILADAPMTGASFQKILAHLPVEEWQRLCQANNVSFCVIDLRDEEWETADNGVVLSRHKLPGDPAGKVLVDLPSHNSEFFSKPETTQQLYGADYNIAETNAAHTKENNRYSISRTAIQADVFINLPKIKTHKKAGITCCLKNLIGINTNKNLLPHHTIGTPKEGGDQFASSSSSTALEGRLTMWAKTMAIRFRVLSPLLVPLKKIAIRVFGDNASKLRSGGWYGNDTLWRTILDLNKAMFYANSDGTLRPDAPQEMRRYIAIADGILAGQGNGPLEPEVIPAGILLCGTNPVSVDCVAAKYMGFDYRKIPQLSHAFEIQHYPLTRSRYEDIQVIGAGETVPITRLPDAPPWVAAPGWVGHIEVDSGEQ